MAGPDFAHSYIGQLRELVGGRVLLSPGAIVVLVRDDGRILVQRRADNGRWELPAGGCEPGQSFRAAAVSELSDETGIELQPSDLIPFATLSDPAEHMLTYSNGDLVHAYAMCFWAPVGDVHPWGRDGEAVEHRWVLPEEMPTPTHPPSGYVLARFRAYLDSGQFQAD